MRRMPTPRSEADGGFWVDASEPTAARGPVGRAWLERVGYASLGILAGVGLWAALLRPTAGPPVLRRSQTQRVARGHSHPIVVEPQAGVSSSGAASESPDGGQP